jgi:transcriptional regulator with XRE-family HTH domain
VAVRSPEHRALGQALRNMRSERAMAQMDLALASGLDRTYVGGIERGERNPSYTSLRRIAIVLDVPVSEWIARAEALERDADAS